MTRWWERGLRVLVSASLVMSLVPVPALAEALDAMAPQEENAVEAETLPENAPVEEIPSDDESAEAPFEAEGESEAEVEAEAEEVLEAEDVDEEASVVSEDVTVDGETDMSNPAVDPAEPLAPELDAAASTVHEMQLNELVDVELESGEQWVGRFVAPEAGTYSFYSEGSEDTYGTLYSDEELSESLTLDDDSGDEANFSITYTLSEGEIVYLEAREIGVEAASFTVSVKMLTSAVHEMALGESVDVELRSDEQWIGRFVAPEAGTYSFYSEGSEDTYGTLFSDEALSETLITDDDGGTDRNFSIEYALSEGEVVYLEAKGYGGRAATFSVSVNSLDLYDIGLPNVWTAYFFNESVPATGSAVEIPEVQLYSSRISESTTFLRKGVDYEVTGLADASGQTIESIVEPGTYTVTIGGIGSYHGSRRLTLSVFDPYDVEKNLYASLATYDFYMRSSTDYSYGCFYHGVPVEPELSVYTTAPSYATLTEGVDYSVTYSGNDGVGVATATVTGMGKYHGTRTVAFGIVETCDLAEYAEGNGTCVRLGGVTRSYSSYYDMSFLYTGYSLRPYVYFESHGYVPQLGTDYTVSYLNASGEPVDGLLEAGTYTIALSSVEGGVFTGSFNMQVKIIANRNMSSVEATLEYSGNKWYSTYSPTDTKLLIGDNLSAEEISQLSWTLCPPTVGSSLVRLIENVDYTVSYDGLTDDGGYAFTFTGIGSYTGTKTNKVYLATPAQAFERFTRYNCTAFVCLDNNRNVVEALAQSGFLVRGRDYVIEGVVDENGEPLTTVPEGTDAYVKMVGIGEYEGCEGVCRAGLSFDEGGISLSSNNVQLKLTNGWQENAKDGVVLHLLKSLVPNVALVVYGNSSVALAVYDHNLLVEEGSGFSVFRRYADDGKSVTVTAMADEGQLFTGSTSIDVALDDAYDLRAAARYVNVSAHGSSASSETYELDNPSTIAVPCWGFTFVPDVQLSSMSYGGFTKPEYEVSMRDANGATVAGISGPGSYELVLVGTGDWTGEVAIPIVAQSAAWDFDVSLCDLKLGAGTEPEVTLTYGGHSFQQGVDYTVEYGNNAAVGDHAWVRVSAIEGGTLYGSRVAGFVVRASGAGTDLAKNSYSVWLRSQAGELYDGSSEVRMYLLGDQTAVEPEIQVCDANGSVLDASCYDVAYYGGSTHGIALVTVTGKNGYTGTLKARYYVATSSAGTGDGWVDLGDGARGYRKDGALVKGWLDLGGRKYRFDSDGKMLTGWQSIGGGKYLFDEDTGAMAVGWTDLVVDGKEMRYYFRPSGNLAIGWADVDGTKYYFRPSGNMATGWAEVDGKNYYFDEDGRMVTGWQQIGDRTYWFRDTGTMATGFATVDGTTRLFRASGSLATGWADWEGKKYYCLDDGSIVMGQWRDIDGKRYYFRPSGSMATGWAEIDGARYYFRNSGTMATGFTDVTDDAYKRYFDENGHMVTGWQEIGGNTYYFRSSGAMQTGTATIDGKSYTFNDKGVLVS